MPKKVNMWAKHHPLKKVMLGDVYDESFFDPIESDDLRKSLQRIVRETKEDLENFKNILESYGVEVIRPAIDPRVKIDSYIRAGDGVGTMVPRPPLQVRDNHVVFGNELVKTFQDHPGIDHGLRKNGYRFHDWSRDEMAPMAAGVFQVGKDLLVSSKIMFNRFLLPEQEQLIREWMPEVRIHRVGEHGHADGVFHPLKPGAIISTVEETRYDQSLPGWDVCYMEEESWKQVAPFRAKKHKLNSWWVEDDIDNDEVQEAVDSWLNEWVGFCEETVFDVNVLMLDENHVFVSQLDNPIANEYFKKHNIEPILVPWRHRFFWDGGIHCITLELEREGSMEDYWPEGREEIVI